MKPITSRGELVSLVNKGIETYQCINKENEKILHTIIRNSRNREYYRIEWGILLDTNKMWHLWYNPEIVKVTLDKRTAKWMTNKEREDYIQKNEDNLSWMYKDGLLFISGETRNFEEEDKVSFVSGKKGSGKSEYAYAQAAKYLKSGRSVLFFSTSTDAAEVSRRIFRTMIKDIYDKLEKNIALNQDELRELNEAIAIMHLGKLSINTEYTIDENYIIKKMYEKSSTKKGLDLVVIDSLSFSDGVAKNILDIHNKIDTHRQILDCKVVITTKLNKFTNEKLKELEN